MLMQVRVNPNAGGRAADADSARAPAGADGESGGAVLRRRRRLLLPPPRAHHALDHRQAGTAGERTRRVGNQSLDAIITNIIVSMLLASLATILSRHVVVEQYKIKQMYERIQA
jgi:hypothetical protein